ncbi:MAG: TetR/AcrR family transcriptional regulator [Ktedonobacteraceae bacterium]|jgi:TetR/AcrR family transcriptional regulator
MAEQQFDKGKCSGRERIIQATKMLAEERPFDDITIEEIIKTAELSRPAFYYHFTDGKEELRAELVQRGLLDAKPLHDNRQAILEAAVRIFARSGVSAATLDDIAAEAGVTRGALLWHFHTKDDLLMAIIKNCGPQSMIRPIIDQIEQDIQNGIALDDESIIRRLAAGFYDGFATQSDITRLAFLVIYTHPQAARMLADTIGKGRKRFAEYIKRRQDEGYFRNDIDPGLFAQSVTMIFAMRAISRGLDDLLPFAHLSREEIIDQLVSLLLYGIVRRDPLPSGETSALS